MAYTTTLPADEDYDEDTGIGEDCDESPKSPENTSTTASQHTPGPWDIRDTQYSAHTIADRVATFPDNLSTLEKQQHLLSLEDTSQANARLIAAAPDLLAALEELYAKYVIMHRFGGVFDNTKAANAAEEAARAAIAKAIGIEA